MTGIPLPVTYDGLVSQIQTYCERTDDDFKNQIDTFVFLAGQRINRDYKGLGAETYVEGWLETGVNTIAKPSNWLETESFSVLNSDLNEPQSVYLRSFEYVNKFGNAVGIPRTFSDYQYSHWLIAPIPDKAYPFKISYIALQDQLNSANQTNWLTKNAPEVLFYACLFEAMLYLKDDARMQSVSSYYSGALSKLNKDDAQHKFTRQNTVMAD